MAIVPAEIVQFPPAVEAQKVQATTPEWPHAFARFRAPAEAFIAEYDSNHIHGVYGNWVTDLEWACKMFGIEARVFV
jgi:L-fucose isomerase